MGNNAIMIERPEMEKWLYYYGTEGVVVYYSFPPNKYATFGFQHEILCSVVLWVNEESKLREKKN